jgi:MFS family permease
LVYYTSAVIIGFYFKKYRNLAFGFAMAGVSTGIMVFPFLLEYCFEKFSPRGSLLIVGGIEAHTIIAGSLMRPINNQKKITINDHGLQNPTDRGCIGKFALSIYAILSPQLLLYLTSLLCYVVGTLGTYAHLPAYLEFFHVKLGRISLVLTVMGIGSLLGRFSSGVFTHKSTVRTYITFISCGIVAAIMEIAAPFIVKYPLGQLVFGAVFSVSCNVFVPLMVPITMDLVPKKNMVSGTGFMYFVGGLGGICGAPLAGNK